MSAVIPSLSRRLSRMRANGRVSRASRMSSGAQSTSLGESLAIGLGCDTYKRRG